ncbi:MAG: type II toxin-antitoxin system RelE/ParE family toxin [Deltaproteobacteria bacterium]|nr:type II toxin-antitoxin system RelE/ParE family toxin [Deltaproteobacteria bacterium]
MEEFIKTLSSTVQEVVYDALTLLEDGETLPMPLSRSLANIHKGLHEIRARDSSGAYRIIYYIKVGEAVYLLHGFTKKTQKTPQKELRLALRRLKEL